MGANKNESTGVVVLSAIALIVGTGLIYRISASFSIPGIKYLMMSPYMAVVVYMAVALKDRKGIVLFPSVIFGVAIAFISIHGSLAIIITGILTEGVLHFIKNPKFRPAVGGVSEATLCVVVSYVIAKYLVVTGFENLPLSWFALAAMMGSILGVFGCFAASRIISYFRIL